MKAPNHKKYSPFISKGSIYATLLKEWLLLRRDLAGMALLLLMPAVLLVVMAMIQDAPFRDYQELHFDLLLADNDGGSLGKEIKSGLKQSKSFNVIDSIDGQPITEIKLKQLLETGDYHVGIVVPKGATAEVVNSSNLLANSISRKLGLGTLPVRESRDTLYVRVFFDPVAKPTFRMSLSFALDKYVTYSSSNLLVKRLSNLSKQVTDTSENDDFKKVFQGVGVREQPLKETAIHNELNSVQHNVPAWAIFGMFFIVIPIAGHLIREREEGSALRVMLIPHAGRGVAMGKILFFMLVCMVQFAFMLSLGLWLLPHLGLSKLALGHHAWVLVPIAAAIAFAATAYGYAVGSFFRTTNQAMPFGAISIVILSAMGGIWVPVEILPQAMQSLAKISPLHWSLDAINQVLLRDGNFASVWKHIAILIVFGLVLYLSAIVYNRKRP